MYIGPRAIILVYIIYMVSIEYEFFRGENGHKWLISTKYLSKLVANFILKIKISCNQREGLMGLSFFFFFCEVGEGIFVFCLFSICSHYVPIKFPRCFQSVPQNHNVFHKTSPIATH
jgi:hypothetical protein